MTGQPISSLERFLDKICSHSRLCSEERHAILSLPGHAVQVQCNRDFVRLGERVDHACLVVDGLVGRFGQNNDGNRQITAVHIGGDMADLHSVVAPESSTALQALAVTTILRVPHEALRRVARERPAIAEAFWRECVIDGATLSEWVVNVGRRDARARTAHLLCEMATRYRGLAPAPRFSFGFPVTQNHLADMLALTPVHVNRTLKCLREEGAADLHGKTAHILDWRLLAHIGEFDGSYLQMGSAPPTSAVHSIPLQRAG